jgi:hypothetical protein
LVRRSENKTGGGGGGGGIDWTRLFFEQAERFRKDKWPAALEAYGYRSALGACGFLSQTKNQINSKFKTLTEPTKAFWLQWKLLF